MPPSPASTPARRRRRPAATPGPPARAPAPQARAHGSPSPGPASLPPPAPYRARGGGAMFVPPRPAIARDRVMHVGYPVAVVVADTLDQARDAAERVVVDYASRPAVVSARDAFAPGAPQLYAECPGNEAY